MSRAPEATEVDPTQRWEANARKWIRWAREPGHDSYWRFHRDAFLPLLPPPPGRVLDVGCGEGRLSRDLKQRGYDAVGVDASATLIAAAREADHDGTYLRGDAATLPFRNAEFDQVIAFMSLHDLLDLDAAVTEAVRVMKPAATLCIAIAHPLNSAGAFVSEDPAAEFVIDDYMQTRSYEDEVERDGLPMTFASVHRPLYAYFDALERNGLVVETLREAGEDDASVAAVPRRRRWQRVPLFMHLRARRGPRSAVPRRRL